MKKLTIEYIRNQFVKEGYILLTEKYKNNTQKLNYICPNKHKHSISWCNWKGNKRCPYCYGHVKLDIEFIRSEFEKEGYQLLTKKYKNNRRRLNYICPEGHKHNISWTSWSNNSRCPYCAGNAKLTIKFIRSEFAKEGYNLLTKKYNNANQKLEYICLNGHRHQITWGNWQQGQRCPYCANVSKPTIEFIRSEFAKEEYKLLTEKYINAHQKLEYICSNEHKHSICWGDWKYNENRCPYCSGKISSEEIQVRGFIKSLNIEISPNDRNQIFNPDTGYGLELDIFMPDLSKAIEYNGEYWHQDKNRDLFKQQLCKSKGINLLIIWDKKWKTQNAICKDKIKKFIFNNERGV